MARKIVAAALGMIALTATAPLDRQGASPAHAAAICYKGGSLGNGRVAGEGSGVLKSKAQYRARRSWGDAAQSAMGSSRARNWSNARHKSYYCHWSVVWHCTAYAQPCM